MRYVISEVDGDFISLVKELKYISDYIDLQKLRLVKDVKMDVIISGEITF